MKCRSIVSLVVALVLVAVLGSLALAQTGPQGQPVPPSVTPPVTAGMSEQDLETAIRALDPNFKVRPTDDKQGKIYELTVTRDGWTYVLRVTSFPNQIWLESSLGKPMSNWKSIPATVLANLLETNYKIGPTHFALNTKKDGTVATLFVCRMLERGQLTSAHFNGYMNDFLNVIRDNYAVWSPVTSIS
jgi:hypothetical protein